MKVLILDKSVFSSEQLETIEKCRVFLAAKHKGSPKNVSDEEVVNFMLTSLQGSQNEMFASGLQVLQTANEVVSTENTALERNAGELKNFLSYSKQRIENQKASLKTMLDNLVTLINS